MSYSYGRQKPAAAAMNRLPIILLILAVTLFIAADLLLDFNFNWVDYAIVIIIALFGIKGYIKGIINTIFSLIGYILGLALAYLFSSKITLIIMQKTELGNTVGSKLNEMMPVLSTIGNFKASESETILDIISRIPELNKAVLGNPLLKQLMSVTSTAAKTGTMYSETVVTMNDLIVYTILKILVFLALFIVIKLLIIVLGKLLTRFLSSSAVLGTANRTAGMVLGFGVGILICYVVFVFAIPVLGSINIVKMPENYTDSVVLAWFNKFILLTPK